MSKLGSEIKDYLPNGDTSPHEIVSIQRKIGDFNLNYLLLSTKYLTNGGIQENIRANLDKSYYLAFSPNIDNHEKLMTEMMKDYFSSRKTPDIWFTHPNLLPLLTYYEPVKDKVEIFMIGEDDLETYIKRVEEAILSKLR